MIALTKEQEKALIDFLKSRKDDIRLELEDFGRLEPLLPLIK